jgi:hypothetical protein
MGGSGGTGGTGEADPNAPTGGDGGVAKVEVDTLKDKDSNKKPSTGISLGGPGGDSSGAAGSGGNAEAKGEQGSKAKIAAEAGDTGDSKSPPKKIGPPQSGTAKVHNEDGAKNGEEAKTPAAQNGGLPGTSVGGIAIGEPGQAADTTSPQPPKSSNPVTGD